MFGVTPEVEETPVTDVVDVSSAADGPAVDAVDEQLLRQLSDRARAEGLRLTGEGGLLGRLTKLVVESSLEGEMDDHLGYGKHDPVGRGRRQLPQRPATQVAAGRGRFGADRGPQGP